MCIKIWWYVLILAYLDFDEFFDSVDDENVLCSFGSLSNDSLVTRPGPAILEGFLACSIIVEVAKDDAWRFDHEFAWLVIPSEFDTVRRDNLCLAARKKRAT